MTSADDADAAVRAACEAASRGDTAKVMTCLHCRPVAAPTGLDERLLPMTAASRRLIDLLDEDPPEHAFRALMAVACCYETPWRAALHMVTAFHSQTTSLGKQSGRVLRTCVTDVQSFLQHTVTSWWKQERQRTSSTSQRIHTQSFPTTNVTPRHLLEQLVDTTLRPLVNDDVPLAASDNQHWTQPLELVTTIVSYCHDLEASHKGTISGYVLDHLFGGQYSVRPDRLLPWLTLGSDLRTHLRDSDWKRLYEMLLQALTNESDPVPPSDMPGLVRAIVSFLSKDQNEWGLIILHLLYASSKDASTYSTVETVLKSSLASLATPILQGCIQACDCKGVPVWIVANMNLLLLQAVQQSGSLMVSNLVSRALGRDGGDVGSGLVQQCWESLMHLSFPSALQDVPQKQRQKGSSEDVIKATRDVMENVYYQGNGQFARDGINRNARNFSTEVVCQSIFLGNTTLSKRSHHVYASERAQRWVHAADTILRPGLDATGSFAQSFLDILSAILIMVTVYCEVPASRSTVVRNTMQVLSGNESFVASNDTQALHCILIATIVRSIQRQGNLRLDNYVTDFSPLSGIFGESLAKDVFQDLAIALAPLPAARTALLSISRKYLHSSFGGTLGWGLGGSSRGMKENRDRIDCALYGLCTLLTSEDDQSWDECGMESWALLSNVIVRNKPALPMSERSCLFERLVLFTKLQKFSLGTTEHLLRESLVRLLQYFDAGHDEPLWFCPEKVFVAWGLQDVSTKGRAHTGQREDIAGLLRLVMALLEHQHAARGELFPETDVSSVLCHGRNHILGILSNSRRHERLGSTGLAPVANCQWMLESRESLCSSVACACIIAVLRSAICNSAQGQPIMQNQRRPDDRSVIERWREKLISAEIEDCTSGDNSSNPEKLLSWTKFPCIETSGAHCHHSSACDATVKNPLLSSLCDIVMDFIFNHRWSRDPGDPIGSQLNDDKKRVVESAVFLIGVKSNLLSREGKGIHVNDVTLSELMFDNKTLCVSASPFLEMCSDVVKASISGSCSLGMTEDLLRSLLDYCSTLRQLVSPEESFGKGIGGMKRCQIIRSLWNLYRAIADDESAQRLVSFLEDDFCQRKGESEDILGTRSFLVIRTDAGVDAIVRRVRLTVLSTLNAWLQALPHLNASWADGFWNGGSQVCSPQESTSLPASFWLECIQAFSSDLGAGIDGRSGGMTEDLFSAYLSLIETSCSLILRETRQGIERRLASQIFNVARESAAILKLIICSFALKGAAQFKKTMMLSSYVLPSMRRQAILVSVASGREGFIGNDKDLAIEVFYQMLDVLRRQHRLGLQASSTWNEIAGTVHIDAKDDKRKDESVACNDEHSTSSAHSANDDIPSVVVIPSDEPLESDVNAATQRQRERKVQLPSKESWSWASACSLAAMERLWIESYSIMQGTVAYAIEPTSPTLLPWTQYCSEHAKELSEVLTASCSAMKTFDELNDMEGDEIVPLASATEDVKKDPMTILAMKFTYAVKVRLCILLERFSIVLQVALRSISTQLKRGGDVGYLVRAESISCICAWLNGDTEELDLVSLTTRWHLAERQAWDAGGSCHNPILRRLPKICVRLRELESDLMKLLQVMIKVENDGTAGPLGVMNQYKELFDPQTDKDSPRVSLQSMIKEKLKSSAKARGVSESFGFTAMDLNESGIMRGWARKRSSRAFNLERQMRKERRRNVPRSRNQIVDNWLNLDERLEEGADNDAYVDLEDFLVDG